jgi:hypothetical protein
MAIPMQALDLIIAGILWITLLAATTDLFSCGLLEQLPAGCLFIGNYLLETQKQKLKTIEWIVCGILQNTAPMIFSAQ